MHKLCLTICFTVLSLNKKKSVCACCVSVCLSVCVRWVIFTSKCTNTQLAARLRPDPLEELIAFPKLQRRG